MTTNKPTGAFIGSNTGNSNTGNSYSGRSNSGSNFSRNIASNNSGDMRCAQRRVHKLIEMAGEMKNKPLSTLHK